MTDYVSSRHAAIVNSQGRNPLVSGENRSPSPKGAAVRYCRPLGATDAVRRLSRGLRPWLLTVGPLGLRNRQDARSGFSLMEMLAVAAVLGVVAVVIVPRLTGGSASSKTAACGAHRGNIEVQAELWRHNTGAWPAANLSDAGANLNYFPGGVPVCPVDGSAFTINSTGRVVGHNH